MRILFTGKEVKAMNEATMETVKMVKEVAPELDTKDIEMDIFKSIKDTKFVTKEEVDGGIAININDDFVVRCIMFTLKMIGIFMPFVSVAKTAMVTLKMLFKGIGSQIQEEAIKFQRDFDLGGMSYEGTCINNDAEVATVRINLNSAVDSIDEMVIKINRTEFSDLTTEWLIKSFDDTITKIKENDTFSFERKVRCIAMLTEAKSNLNTVLPDLMFTKRWA